jgi:flavin reductase (DIM6/NTAB) family NADH-FMN oxidoreductase RutF/GNAT superfamily N-acetyltransferase
MSKISAEISNLFCPQTLFVYGTRREDGGADFGLFCWISYYADGGLCMMAGISEDKLTRDNIERTGVFSANLVTEKTLALADYFGCNSGYDKGKMDIDVNIGNGRVLDVPVLSDSPVAFELEVYRKVELDSGRVYLCRIRNVLADEELFGSETLEEKMKRIAPVCAAGNTYFGWNGERIAAWGEPGLSVKAGKAVNIEIRKLTEDRAGDYLHFFDVTPHSTGKDEHRCYCVCWAGEDCGGRDFTTAEKRRAVAAEYIKSGALQGYLAYIGHKVVGWCNANAKSDCYDCLSWKMFMQDIKKDEPGIRVKSVFCYAVAPEMRRKGIAAQLLSRVCDDAAEDGFDFVEAYPNRLFVSEEDDFIGTVGMYEKAGFEPFYEAGGKIIMRKNLKQRGR